MKYYKWIWSDEQLITGIPGFVWPDEQTAIAKYDDYIEWTCGDTKSPNLFVMEAPRAIEFPLGFDGRLCFDRRRRHPKPLTDLEQQRALAYFQDKSEDCDGGFFGTNKATEDDVLLFLDFAASVGAIKTSPNPVLDEYFIGREVKMIRTK